MFRRSCRRRGTAPAARSRSRPEARERDLADVDAVQEHRARRRFVQARQQADECRLARSGRADERHRLPGLDAQRHVFEDRKSAPGYVNTRLRNSIAAGERRRAAGLGHLRRR